LPFVQKLRRGGYDGRGVRIIKTAKDLEGLLEGASLVEEMVRVRKEISVIAAGIKREKWGVFRWWRWNSTSRQTWWRD
jgi:5-(carboxyamino)imidazole ribonucleotide synthase